PAGRRRADTLGAARRFRAIDTAPVAVQDGPGVAATRAGAAALEMDGVTFTYPGRSRPALADVRLVIPAGSTVALVGPSGAGKTTIAHLFLRFWDPDKGGARLDGHDLRDYRLDDLRRRVALVAQDTYLFNDSLRNNVLMARPGATGAEVEAAVDRPKQDRTTLVIAHRLSTVRGADTIVVLDHGRVIESGSHAELLGRRGLYARLIAAQLSAVSPG